MIYIEEKCFERQIEMIAFLVKAESFSICAWLYPESKINKLGAIEVIDNESGLQPVTTYGEGVKIRRTRAVQASNENLIRFKCAKSALVENCDSLALYAGTDSHWMACTIGHEGMCLVQDDSRLSNLISEGFNASLKPPSWW